MLGEPLYVPTTRRMRLRIGATTNPGKLAALATTTAEWDQAVSFNTNIFPEHPGVFEARTTRMVRSGPHAGTTRESNDSPPQHPTRAQSGGGLPQLPHRPTTCCNACGIRRRVVVPQ